MKIIERVHLDALFHALEGRGYEVVGPTVREETIVYDTIHSAADLPEGWTDDQEAGKYRLRRRDDKALFGYAVGPHSWKRYLVPPARRLWSAERNGGPMQVQPEKVDAGRRAFIGVRSCELNAMEVQDRVYLEGPFVAPDYRSRRGNAFICVVQCSVPGGTCFCASMGTGPRAKEGFDLAMTEVLLRQRHYFVAEAGSSEGNEILEEIGAREATEEEIALSDKIVDEAAHRMGRAMNTDGIKELLYRNHDHPEWDDVAARCLTCANCTMACPTCFCHTVEDTTDLSGDHAERWAYWDSCFTMDFSYIHGGSLRPSTQARYRQWMTHKLASWIDQFGTSGCVGCGRCITWCPVGIDITEEVARIRKTDRLQRDPATAEKER